MDKDLELICFNIIAMAGTATGYFSDAIKAAKDGDFTLAEQRIKEGDEASRKAHDVHVDLIQSEAGGEKIPLSLILLHSEDQMMASENMRNMAVEFIDLYKILYEKFKIKD